MVYNYAYIMLGGIATPETPSPYRSGPGHTWFTVKFAASNAGIRSASSIFLIGVLIVYQCLKSLHAIFYQEKV